jgi:hypothetical protein
MYAILAYNSIIHFVYVRYSTTGGLTVYVDVVVTNKEEKGAKTGFAMIILDGLMAKWVIGPAQREAEIRTLSCVGITHFAINPSNMIMANPVFAPFSSLFVTTTST